MPKDLAALLTAEGAVSSDALKRALERQREAGGSLDTALLETGVISEEALGPLLARASELPLAPDWAWKEADVRARRVFPSRVAERHSLAPFALEGRELFLVATNPVDVGLLDEISFMLSLHLTAHVGPEWRVRMLIHRMYGAPLSARHAALAAAAGVEAVEVAALREPEVPPPPPPLTGFERDEEEPLEPLAAALAQAVEALDLGGDDEPPASEDLEPPASAGAPPRGAPDRTAPPKWKLADARAALAAAQDRDEVVLVALRYARDFFEYAAFFAVTRDAVAGHDALGDDQARERARALAVWSADPGITRTVIETRSPYLGPVSSEAPGNKAILSGLKRETPRTALVYPVALRERVVALLYADNGQAPVSPRRLGNLLLLLSGLGAAFERIIRARKWPPRRTPPIDGDVIRPPPEEGAGESPEQTVPPASADGVEQAGSPTDSPASSSEGTAAPASPPQPAESAESPERETRPVPEDVAPPPASEPPVEGAESPERETKPVPEDVAPPPASQPPPAESAESPERETMPVPEDAAQAPASQPPPVEGAEPSVPDREPSPAPATAISAHAADVEGDFEVDVDHDHAPDGHASTPTPPEGPERLPEEPARLEQAATSLEDLERQFFGDDLFGSIAEVEGPPQDAQDVPEQPTAAPRSSARDEAPEALTPGGDASAGDPPSSTRSESAGEPKPPGSAAASPAELTDRALDPDPEVASSACEALAACRRDPALLSGYEKLRRALLSGIAIRTARAARALGAMRDVEAIPLLVQVMETSEPEAARAAADALEVITLQRHGTDARKWLAWWKWNRGRGRAEWLFSGLTSDDRETRVAAEAELRKAADAPIEYSPDMPALERERAARIWAGWWARSGNVL